MSNEQKSNRTLFGSFRRKLVVVLAIVAVIVLALAMMEDKPPPSQTSAEPTASADRGAAGPASVETSLIPPPPPLPDAPPLVTAVIDPGATSGHFRAALLGSNILWSDQGCNILDSTFNLRANIVTTLKNMGVPVLRYPGGLVSSTYIWQNGVGPQASRGESLVVGNYPQIIRFGTDEYLSLLEKLGGHGLITLNSDASPKDALAWYDYVAKAANGQRVLYWEFGNESFVPTDPSFTTVDKYVQAYANTAELLKSKHPSIKLGAILEASLMDVPWAIRSVPQVAIWNDKVVEATRDTADFYALHPYGPTSVTVTGGRVLTRKEAREGAQLSLIAPLQVEENIKKIQKILDKYNSKAELFITEFNLLYYESTDLVQFMPSLTQTNYVAQNLMIFARQNIAVANFYSLLNDYMFGQVTTETGQPVMRQVGRLYEALSAWGDSELVAVSTKTPLPVLPYEPRGMIDLGLRPELLDMTVLKRKDGKMMLVAINRSVDLGAYLDVRLLGPDGEVPVVIEEITGLYQDQADLLARDNTLPEPVSEGLVHALPPYPLAPSDEHIVAVSPADVVMITFSYKQ